MTTEQTNAPAIKPDSFIMAPVRFAPFSRSKSRGVSAAPTKDKNNNDRNKTQNYELQIR
jgi:hypothetical protein